jgi:VWFA-related protein
LAQLLLSKRENKCEGEKMVRKNCKGGSTLLLGLALTVWAFILLGCSGGGGSGGGENPSGSASITLSENLIDFGNQVIGGEPATRSLTILNTGDANLVISEIGQVGAPFELYSDTCSNQTLKAGSSCSVLVRFVPEALDNFSDSFDILSNARNGIQTVGVLGNGRNWRVKINDVYDDEYPLIKMIVSVTGPDRKAIENLAVDNFRVSEGGTLRDILVSAAAEIRAVSVVLCLDYSGSIQPVISSVKESAKNFLQTFINPDDEAAVIKFATTVYQAIGFVPVVNDLLSDDLLLFAAIEDKYPDSVDGTKFYDAVYESVGLLANVSLEKRRAVVVVSDGVESLTPSTENMDSVLEHAARNAVSVYTIGLGGKLDASVMGQLADDTGGLYLELATMDPNDVGQALDQAYQEIALAFSKQYEITFTTGSTEVSEKILKVEAVESGSLQGDDTVLVIY